MIGQLKFLLRTRNLSNIERCANILHIQRYNVAEHSFYTAFYALFFADLENRRISASDYDFDEPLYDCKKLLYKAILHDLEECVTGDILYPIKHGSYNFSEVICKVVEETLFAELDPRVARKYIEVWSQAKDDSKEGQLIEAMDKFELMLFSFTELMLGNVAVKPIYEKALEILRGQFHSITSLGLVVQTMEDERRNGFNSFT
jgi:5'-deoxynucleotidase YfbR-like HD superfamily hydrolase